MRAGVVGGGSWGTALAALLARRGHEVCLWTRREAVASAIRATRTNEAHLPGVPLPAELDATSDLERAVADADVIFVALPSEVCRGIYRRLRSLLPGGATLVSATKGLEVDTLQRMTEVAAEEVPGQALAVLSGPSFAWEVAREQPTAVVVASRDLAVAEGLQRAVAGRTFRAYSSDDVTGVELAGALKNVIAIAAGIVDGLGYGHNTVAALLTRGLAEITRLAVARGGRADTLAGLAGLGDLVLTCTGGLSRNRSVGQALGRGQSLAKALAAVGTAEGVRSTRAACALAAAAGIDLPIALQMRSVLYENKPPREAVEALMLRSLKRE